jgi:hypothetical protein
VIVHDRLDPWAERAVKVYYPAPDEPLARHVNHYRLDVFPLLVV